MILVAFRHGFRASEICELGWDAIDFDAAEMHVTRKKSKPSTHPIRGDELRALTSHTPDGQSKRSLELYTGVRFKGMLKAKQIMC